MFSDLTEAGKKIYVYCSGVAQYTIHRITKGVLILKGKCVFSHAPSPSKLKLRK